jgi:hypothetical protein
MGSSSEKSIALFTGRTRKPESALTARRLMTSSRFKNNLRLHTLVEFKTQDFSADVFNNGTNRGFAVSSREGTLRSGQQGIADNYRCLRERKI